MKKKSVFNFLLIVIFLLSARNVMSQDNLNQVLSDIKGLVGEVQIDKITFKQSIEVIDEQKGKIKFTSIAVDDKGKTENNSYEIYVSDIDKNTIIRKTSGKKLIVNMWTNNKQKFIKYMKNDNLDSYTDNIEILVSDADNAQKLIDLFKKAIPLVKSSEQTFGNATDALNWLKGKVSSVTTKEGKTDQTFSFADNKNYLVTITQNRTDSKGSTTDEKYELNILDLNKNDLQLKVSGSELSVRLEIKGGDKFIAYTKNNEQQSYTSSVEILSDDIDQARQIIAALSAAIDKSKSIVPGYISLQQATDFISKNVGEVVTDSKTTSQKITFVPGDGTQTTLTISESDGKGKTVSSEYNFYLSDIDMNSIFFKVSGKKVVLTCTTSGKDKLIKNSKDNIQQNFAYDFEILAPNIETARDLAESFRYAVKNSQVTPKKWGSISEAMEFLTNTIKGDAVGSDKYQLTFDGDYTEPFQCKYTENKTDAKGVSTEMTYVFYPSLFDANSVKIESGGKNLVIKSSIKNGKSFVKKMKGEVSQGFTGNLEIMAFDAKQARGILDALKYLIATCVPKEKDWSDVQTAVKFVIESVGNFSNSSKEVKQKLEMVNGEPCKLSLTVSTTDDKGKTLEEIYEFGLSDMNKLMVDYKVQGNNVYIVMVCKNKEKFVKVYKNGVQQSFGSDVQILEDDVETARNIADALRNAIIVCQK